MYHHITRTLGPHYNISFSFPFVQPMDPPYWPQPIISIASPLLTDSSSQSYHTANMSPYIAANSTSTSSSIRSFPYSVTSIGSYKSRKNVLYPRRVHPLPVAVSSGHSVSVSPDALIWQVRFLCTTLLPYAETRLVSAGRVLLQSLRPYGDFSQHVPIQTDEETRCCSELFIVLTHEVLLRDAVSAGELEGPCKLLHRQAPTRTNLVS
ncbi:hypothetical protein H4582DRAFT_1350408 [Lactarius indigo]|nr:hypothetical protein H4582DRAFT_1350408 [Lactarius indigo]